MHYGLTGDRAQARDTGFFSAVSRVLFDCQQNEYINFLSLQNSRVGLDNILRAKSCASTLF